VGHRPGYRAFATVSGDLNGDGSETPVDTAVIGGAHAGGIAGAVVFRRPILKRIVVLTSLSAHGIVSTIVSMVDEVFLFLSY
jgi:hypothetical protein